MSVQGHEAAANEQEQLARTHSAEFDPTASSGSLRCGAHGACWTPDRNPTAEHLAIAEQHRKMAADHRAASQALRDAEARACVGISEADRNMSPFEHRADVESVTPLEVTVGPPKVQYKRRAGAVVTLRATPGMSAPWLQRLVDCHLARNAALGHVVPEMPSCPLVPKDVAASVTATRSGFAVTITSDDDATVEEIIRRAESLR